MELVELELVARGVGPLNALLAAVAQLPVGFVYRPQQFDEAWRLIHGPQPIERRAEQAHVILGKQADGYDTIRTHTKLRKPLAIKTLANSRGA